MLVYERITFQFHRRALLDWCLHNKWHGIPERIGIRQSGVRRARQFGGLNARNVCQVTSLGWAGEGGHGRSSSGIVARLDAAVTEEEE